MRKIQLALFLAAALTACQGKQTLSDQSESVTANGHVGAGGASLQSKVAMPAPPAAPAMGIVAGVATAADGTSPMVAARRADQAPDDIQSVSYASTANNTMI